MDSSDQLRYIFAIVLYFYCNLSNKIYFSEDSEAMECNWICTEFSLKQLITRTYVMPGLTNGITLVPEDLYEKTFISYIHCSPILSSFRNKLQ